MSLSQIVTGSFYIINMNYIVKLNQVEEILEFPNVGDTGSSALGKQVPQRWGNRFLSIGDTGSVMSIL
jgi:hypothetical protein